MKIGITCHPTYGGSGIVATELGMELAARGHEVHFISYAHPIRLQTGLDRVHYHEVEVTNYPLFAYPPYCLALAARMAEVAESYNLDLLHVHYAIPHAATAWLASRRATIFLYCSIAALRSPSPKLKRAPGFARRPGRRMTFHT